MAAIPPSISATRIPTRVPKIATIKAITDRVKELRARSLTAPARLKAIIPVIKAMIPKGKTRNASNPSKIGRASCRERV